MSIKPSLFSNTCIGGGAAAAAAAAANEASRFGSGAYDYPDEGM